MTARRLLLVEDNQDDEELTRHALRDFRVANEVVVLRDGEEAVQFIKREGPYAGRDAALPCAVLLDLKLPKRDGFEVLAAIRSEEAWAGVPVIVLSSSNLPEDVSRAYRNGANSFVRKPVVLEEFVAAVNHIGCYWLLLNERPR
jgi:CheY-like chemotaxis protein